MNHKYTAAQLDYIEDVLDLSVSLMTEAQHREFQAMWAAKKPAKAATPIDPALKAHRAVAKKFGGKALTGTAKQKSWAESLRAEVLGSVSEAEALALCKYHAFCNAKFWIESRAIAADKIGAVGLMTRFAIDTANGISAHYKKSGHSSCYDTVACSLADAVNAAAEGFFTQILAIDIKSATAYLQELQTPEAVAAPVDFEPLLAVAEQAVAAGDKAAWIKVMSELREAGAFDDADCKAKIDALRVLKDTPAPTPPAVPVAPAPAQPAAPAPAPKFRSGLMPRGHAEQTAKVPGDLAEEIAAAKKLYSFSAGKKQSAAHFAAATAVNEKLRELGLMSLMLFVGDAPTAPTEPAPVAPVCATDFEPLLAAAEHAANEKNRALWKKALLELRMAGAYADAGRAAKIYALEKIMFPPTAHLPPKMEGQLWEPCRCGREPVYMPLHLCEKCWPKSTAPAITPAAPAVSPAPIADADLPEHPDATKREFFASIEPTAEEIASVAAPTGRPPRRGAAGKDPRQTPAFLARAYRLWMQHSDPAQLARDDYAAALVKSGGKYWTSDDGNHKRVYLANDLEFYDIKTGETKKI